MSQRIGAAGTEPALVLRRLASRAAQRRLPAPAALVGHWFGARAVVAPSVAPVGVASAAEAFAVPTRQPTVHSAPPGAVGGGWFGYLGYGLTDPGEWPRRLPSAAWGWADHVLRCAADGQWWFEALVADDAPDPTELATELATLVGSTEEPPRSDWSAGTLTRSSAQRHQQAVRDCLAEIRAGEIYQANVCTRFETTFTGSAVELFADGVIRLRASRSAFLAGDWGALASFSPELFLARHGNHVRSVPIKGTLPRRGPADDENAVLLRHSAKDVAENIMIVDLVRNDLGRVAVPGSVRVPELLAVRPAPGVWHLSSTVTAELAPGVDDAALLAATFPPGSVTGTPKLRALEIIAELERFPREVYCGAIGLASPVAGLELNVAIRTLELSGDRLWLGVGGGIVADSDPVAEWQECLHKAAAQENLLHLRAAGHEGPVRAASTAS